MAEQTNSSNSVTPLRVRTLEPTEGERHASWLELFFDLVFVLAVAEIAKILAGHSDVYGIVKFIALFVPIWWTWVGFTFYADRFETDEKTYRVLMFAAMFAVRCSALCRWETLFQRRGDISFVICYVLVRTILIALYAAFGLLHSAGARAVFRLHQRFCARRRIVARVAFHSAAVSLRDLGDHHCYRTHHADF